MSRVQHNDKEDFKKQVNEVLQKETNLTEPDRIDLQGIITELEKNSNLSYNQFRNLLESFKAIQNKYRVNYGQIGLAATAILGIGAAAALARRYWGKSKKAEILQNQYPKKKLLEELENAVFIEDVNKILKFGITNKIITLPEKIKMYLKKSISFGNNVRKLISKTNTYKQFGEGSDENKVVTNTITESEYPKEIVKKQFEQFTKEKAEQEEQDAKELKKATQANSWSLLPNWFQRTKKGGNHSSRRRKRATTQKRRKSKRV